MGMSRDQNVGSSHNIEIDNSSFERVEQFKYLGTNLTGQHFVQEEMKGRLKSGNACYRSVKNVLSSSLLSKNLNIKISRTAILPVVLYGCETWSPTLREELRVSLHENRELRIFGATEVRGNKAVGILMIYTSHQTQGDQNVSVHLMITVQTTRKKKKCKQFQSHTMIT
jgi:hypothetical protein